MEVVLKNNVLSFKHKLTKKQTYNIKDSKGLFQLAIYNKPEWVSGISSMCEDGKHILMLDYDNVAKWVMLEDLKTLIKKGCSPFFILKTKEEKIDGVVVGNYQAICLDKLYVHEILDKQRITHCDSNYINMPLRTIFRSWILRNGKKGKRNAPKFVKVFGDKNLDNHISQAHYEWLKKQYNIPKLEYSNIDGQKRLFKNIYETINRVK